MLYTKQTTRSVQQVTERLQAAAPQHQMGVLAVHDLKQKMADKDIPFGPQCRVIEVCNPRQAQKVLQANIAISNALPCRIAVYEEGGKVTVSTLLPTALLSLFSQPELRPVAQEVEKSILAMIEEACR